MAQHLVIWWISRVYFKNTYFALGYREGSIHGLPLWLSWYRIRLQYGRTGFNPWVGKIPWRRERLPTPLLWPGEFRVLYSPWGCKELDTTERLSLSYMSGLLLCFGFPLFLLIFFFSICSVSYWGESVDLLQVLILYSPFILACFALCIWELCC